METVGGALCCTGIDAVAMDNLDRTRSSGYVVPETQRDSCSQSGTVAGETTKMTG